MSEPIKNVEIEDVLSSIRRLVSENHRQPAPEPSPASARPAERLVLTQALRVSEPQIDKQQDVSEPTAERTEYAEAEAEDASAQEAQEDTSKDVLQTEHHADQEAHENEDWHQHDHDASRPDDHKDEIERPPEASLQQSHEGDDHLTEENGSAGQENSDHQQDDRPEDDHHNDAVSHEEESEQSDGGNTQEHIDEDRGEHVDADNQTDSVETHSEDKTEEDASYSEEPPAWQNPNATLYAAAGLSSDDETAEQDDMRPLGEKIAALEEVIAQTDDQWEPDDPGSDDYAGTNVETLEWEDAEASAEAESTDPAPEFVHRDFGEHETDAKALEDTAETSGEETMLDEQALRELVAEIVREELQGVLGERITRNVRKLVRREIHRALAVQELE